MQAYGSGQDSKNFVKFRRTPFLQNTSGQLLLQLLNETHLEVVKGLIQLRGFNQHINNKSSSERCYYVRTERTDICYANAKKLLQSGKSYIEVAFISLVPFRHLSFLDRGRLISCINISSFQRSNISYRFLSNFLADGVSSLRVKYDIFVNED